MLTTAIQWTELAICIYISPSIWISPQTPANPTHLGHHRTLSWASSAIKGFLLAIYFTHGSVYIWASLVAQMVKNLPAMQETRVQSLGWEDPLEESLTIHSSILVWRIHMDRGAWRATVHGVAKSWTWMSEWAQVCVYIYQSQSPNSSHPASPHHLHTYVLNACFPIPALQIAQVDPYCFSRFHIYTLTYLFTLSDLFHSV